MANNQNPTMGAPMGAGRSLNLPNQFFKGPQAGQALQNLGGAGLGGQQLQAQGGAPHS